MKPKVSLEEKTMGRLDLSQPIASRKPEPPVAKFKISLKKWYDLIGIKPYRGKFSIKLVSKINNTDIKVRPGCDVLTMECNSQSGNNLTFDSEIERQLRLDINFNPVAIEDCNNRSISQFSIDYTIERTCISDSFFAKRFGKKKKSKSISDTATIALDPIPVYPIFLPQRFDFEYQAEAIEKTLQIRNSSVLHYAPTACIRIINAGLYDKNGIKDIPDAVKVLLKPKESKTYVPGDIIIKPIGSQPSIANSKGEIECIYPENGYWIELPLAFDLSKIPNPQQEQDTYLFKIEYEYWNSANTRRISGQEKIKVNVRKNHERIELGVNLQENSARGFINTAAVCGVTHVEQPLFVNGQGTGDYRIAIQNLATVIQTEHPKAGIIIRDLTCNGIAFTKGTTAKTNNNETIKLNDICRCDSLSIQQRRLLPNDFIPIDIPFVFGQANIDYFLTLEGKKVFRAEAEVKLSFDYFIDETGELPANASFTHFEGSVVFNLEKEPRREWLSVDFGTSAVVALYGSAIDLENAQANHDNIKDLRDIKFRGLARAYTQPQPVTDESIFINSKIILGDNFPNGQKKVVRFEDYRKGNILFSPGDVFNYSLLLPSLKSMMGYDKIPLKMSGVADLHVDSIYEMAYQQLFSLYLQSVSQGQPIEKIVMTYPNTFAAKHVACLKKLAKECLPTLRDDYIVTLSESDAVAYYFLMSRFRILEHADEDTHRNVLIYDMGAGTLDITYLNNIVEDGKRKVDIQGKFGISKAGNYLDYILAEIVVDICDRNGITDANGQSFKDYLSLKSNRSIDIDTCSKLKNYVKDKLKPLLAETDGNGGTRTMPNWDNIATLDTIPLSEVFQHTKFKEFITDISTRVIKGCDDIFPSTLKDIDAVVFSGRMTTMKAIRKAVIDAIKKTTGKDVIPIDIADNEDAQYEPLQTRKTAVVEGALNYVENFIHGGQFTLLPPKPFYAHYCVIVQRGSQYEVIDLVDNSMAANNYINTETITFSGNDIAQVSAIYLIQTYAVGNNAIIDDFRGNRNLTTVLEARSTTNITGSRRVEVKVLCQGEGNRFEQGTKPVGLWIGNIKIEQLPHENIKSEAFRKSAWPIVF